jgi:hypothetical protein
LVRIGNEHFLIIQLILRILLNTAYGNQPYNNFFTFPGEVEFDWSQDPRIEQVKELQE